MLRDTDRSGSAPLCELMLLRGNEGISERRLKNEFGRRDRMGTRPALEPTVDRDVCSDPCGRSYANLQRGHQDREYRCGPPSLFPTFVVVMGSVALLATELHGLEGTLSALAYRLLDALPDDRSAMLYSLSAITSPSVGFVASPQGMK
jgi:hypothetical protein